MSRPARIVAIALLGSLMLAACSSSSDSSGGSDSGGGGGSSTQAPVQSSSSSSSSGGSAGTFDSAQCQEAVDAMAKAGSAVPAAMSGGAGDIQASLDELQAFADNAPDEIKSDMQTVAQGYAAFVKAMADAGYDPTSGQPPSAEAIAAIQAAAASLDTTDFRTASKHVSDWFQTNCGG